MKALYRCCVCLAAIGVAAAALPAPGAELALSGVVQELQGEAVVLRGVQTRTLVVGDKIFLGDRIITRSGGQVGFTILDCKKALGSVQSIYIDEDICAKQAIALVTPLAAAPFLSTAGGAVASTAGGAVAASPALFLPLLATGGAVTTAAALASGASARPASP